MSETNFRSVPAKLSCHIQMCLTLVLCALCFICADAQQAPTSSSAKDLKPSGRSVIRGRVIYADTGRPLRRAEVFLVPQDGAAWPRESVTDRNGEFDFNNVSAGKYFVVVKALDIVSHYLEKRTSLSLKIALGQIEDGFSEVTVDGRGSVKTEIRASRGGVITGRVMSETDEPIAEAQIKLFKLVKGKLHVVGGADASLGLDKRMFETDSRGTYRISGLATGEYVVQASESDKAGNSNDAAEGSYTNGSMMVAFHPKALKIQDATSVKVQQGSETKDVDINFIDRTPHRVSGTVLVRGKPARGVEISFTRDEPEVEGSRRLFGELRTDSDGHWEIRSVPDGNYTLLAFSLGGFVRVDDEQRYAHVSPRRLEITVAGADVTDLKVEMAEGVALNGVVSVEGGSQLPDRLKIDLISPVLSSGNADDVSHYSEAPAVGDAFVVEKGTFSISQLIPGSFHFRLSNLGTGLYVKSITLNGKDLLRNPVRVEKGKNLQDVRIVLSSELVSLSGRVVEKSDKSKPSANAAVLLFPVEVERRRVGEGPIPARSDKEGRFTVKAAPGEYFVFVFDRRRNDGSVAMPAEASLIKNASTLQKISVQRGDEKRIIEVVGP